MHVFESGITRLLQRYSVTVMSRSQYGVPIISIEGLYEGHELVVDILSEPLVNEYARYE